MFKAVGVPAWVLWSGSLLWCGITGVATHKPHAHRPNRGSYMQYNLGYNANQLSFFSAVGLFLCVACIYFWATYRLHLPEPARTRGQWYRLQESGEFWSRRFVPFVCCRRKQAITSSVYSRFWQQHTCPSTSCWSLLQILMFPFVIS